jgi:hypothetical protein
MKAPIIRARRFQEKFIRERSTILRRNESWGNIATTPSRSILKLKILEKWQI